jgi:hypothetical protein
LPTASAAVPSVQAYGPGDHAFMYFHVNCPSYKVPVTEVLLALKTSHMLDCGVMLGPLGES